MPRKDRLHEEIIMNINDIISTHTHNLDINKTTSNHNAKYNINININIKRLNERRGGVDGAESNDAQHKKRSIVL
jgi:hypothetical protein